MGGVEPVSMAANTFKRSVHANRWSGLMDVLQAALANASTINEKGTPSLQLSVPAGRVGEASAAGCVVDGCSTLTAPLRRVDKLLEKGVVVDLLKANVMGFELEVLLSAV